MEILQNIAVVMSHTSHPGNIGAAARAMKNMGLHQLILVSPNRFPSGEAVARAAGADDILRDAKIVSSLDEALADFQVVLGTTGRSRHHLAWPMLEPEQAAEFCIKNAKQRIAILFGNEQNGLSNEELAKCTYHVTIPTSAEFCSLNLGAAVQVLVYEVRKAALRHLDWQKVEAPKELATQEQLEGLYQHWCDIMEQLGFLDRTHPKLLIKRIQRIFGRTQLEDNEINILRGFLSAVGKKLK